ncbi:N-acetyltransferase family protein [Rhizobium mongolense]|uniref:GNAT family N-acetyltransferase n=1 Tax=Rhizobium mongolense TaxID=57676 RepID=UPI003558E778
MSYQVRPLATGDLRSVTKIHNAACRAGESTEGTRPWSIQEMREFMFESRPLFESYTCVDKGAVVGWTALTRFRVKEDAKHTAEMSLYVQEAFRRKGIGSALAQTVLNRASMLNLHCIFAMVFKEATGVISFAERKCGFSVAGCLPEVFSDGEKHYDIFVLEKLISPPP